MITHLNQNINSWVHIYKIDLAGSHPDQDNEEYFVNQLDTIVDQQYKIGYHLKSITGFFGSWILIFTPQRVL